MKTIKFMLRENNNEIDNQGKEFFHKFYILPKKLTLSWKWLFFDMVIIDKDFITQRIKIFKHLITFYYNFNKKDFRFILYDARGNMYIEIQNLNPEHKITFWKNTVRKLNGKMKFPKYIFNSDKIK